MSEPRVCAICGTPCRPPFRAPAAELAPDLDGRPGEPARSTLPRWIATCRACSAAAPDLAALPDSAAATVRSERYHALPSPYLRWAAICEAAGWRQDAAEATLQAAWALDDRGGDAAELRQLAAELWEGDALRKIDILRRSGQTALAEALATPLAQTDDEAGRIASFQLERIRAGDTGRHAISSALRPPSRTPHVAHGKIAGGGLLTRWFGRRS